MNYRNTKYYLIIHYIDLMKLLKTGSISKRNRAMLIQTGNVTYKGMEIYKLVEPEILAAINENNHLQDLNRNVLVHTFNNDKIPVTPEEMNQQTREFIEQLPEKDVLFFTLPLRRLYKGYLRHTAMEDFIGAIPDDQYIDIELMFQSEDYNSPVITKNRQIVNILTVSTIYEMNTIDNDEMLQVFIKEIIAPIENVINRKLNKDIVLQCYFKLCIVLRQHKSFITFYKKIIEKVKPKVIIYSHGQDAYLSMLRDAAREMKIPTLEVDHGVSTIQKYHSGLMYSDYFLLYSKINERVCERSGNNHVIGVGKPYVYDNVACNHLDKIIIAFISSIECEIFDYAKNLAKKLNPSKYLVVYKTHSAEVWSEEEKKQEEKETPNLMFMDGFVDINDLYENVDVVVAMRTSGLFDALPYQNIKIIVAPDPAVKNSVWTLDELIEDVGKCGDFVMTRTEEELFNEVVSYKRGEIYRDKPNCCFQMDPEQRFRDITNYFMKNGKNLI